MNSHRHPILQLLPGKGLSTVYSAGEVGLGTKILFVLRVALSLPFWILQVISGTKSFADNPVIGSKRLNRLGLHIVRVRASHAMARWRRARLGQSVPIEYRAEFASNGFIRIDNYLPADQFLILRDAILTMPAPAREMLQGDTITRRIAIDSDYLAKIPQVRTLISSSLWRGLVRYVANSASEPLYYVQTILTHRTRADPDPQTTFHADTFHPTMKAWYFLEDVAEDEGAFRYVPGSHKLTAERLAWERARSIAAPEGVDRLSARGSMRIMESELRALKLPQPQTLSVKANTLVIADTFGFHARGHASRPTRRVELWAYSRRNPFYPWIGLDPFSLRGLAERRISWIWSAKDRFPKLFGAPWHDAGRKVPDSE